MGQQIKAVLAGKHEVSLEQFFLFSGYVLAFVVQVLLSQTKINYFHLMEILFVTFDKFWKAYHDIVKFQVVIGIS